MSDDSGTMRRTTGGLVVAYRTRTHTGIRKLRLEIYELSVLSYESYTV